LSKSRREREEENLPILAEIVQYDDPAQIPSSILAKKFGVSQPRIAALIRAAHNPNTWRRLKEAYGYTEAKRRSWVGQGEEEQAAHVYPSTALRATPAQESKGVPPHTGIEPVNNTAHAHIEPQADEHTHAIPESSGVLTPEVSFYPVPANNDKPIQQYYRGHEIVNPELRPQEKEERNTIFFPVSPLQSLRHRQIQDTYEQVQYQESMCILEQVRDFYADQRAEHESKKKHKENEESSSLLKDVLTLIKAEKEQEERDRNQMLYNLLLLNLFNRRQRR